MDAAARQKVETVSQLLLKAGNQYQAWLLSLVDEVEIGTAEPWDPTSVVLRVRPLFLELFRPADLDAIARGLSQMKVFGQQKDEYRVTAAPALADPFAPTGLGSGTENHTAVRRDRRGPASGERVQAAGRLPLLRSRRRR